MKSSLELLEKEFEELKILSSKMAELQLSDLRSMNELSAKIVEEQAADEAMTLLKDFGENFKGALPFVQYYLAVLEHTTGSDGDMYLEEFIHSLVSIGKSKLVFSVCQMFLDEFESLLAINTLIAHYEKNGSDEQLIELLKRVIPRNRKDVSIPKKIARLFEKVNVAEAKTYYEIALLRSFQISDFAEAADCWKRLIVLDPKDVDLHLNWLKRIVTHLLPEQKHALFSMLIKNQEHSLEGRKAIVKIIKACLRSDVIPFSQLFLLLKSYREIYESHVYLNDFLSLSGLIKTVKNAKKPKMAQNILSQIHTFEKYICFEKNTFVSHNSFGLGMIREFIRKEKSARPLLATEAKLIVDFQKKENHSMSLGIAFNSLELCYKDHLLALKSFRPERLQEIIAGDEASFLRHTLLTLAEPSTQKEIHELLCPAIFKADTWQKRWKGMKNLFDEINEFEYNGKTYALVEKGYDLHTRSIDSLKKTTKIEEKLRIIESYFIQISIPSPKVLLQMKEESQQLIQRESPYTLLLLVFKQQIHSIELGGKAGDKAADIVEDFKKSYSLENFRLCFNICNFQQFRHMLLLNLEAAFAESFFFEQMQKLFLLKTIHHKEYIFHFLDKRKHVSIMRDLLERSAENYLENSESFFIASRHFVVTNMYKTKEERAEGLYKLVRLLAEFNRLISIGKNPTESKKLFHSLSRLLFDEQYLSDFLESEEASIEKHQEEIFLELEKQAFLDEDFKVKIRALHEKHRARKGA